MPQEFSGQGPEHMIDATKAAEGLGGAATSATTEVITRVPGFEGAGNYTSPEGQVAKINEALANRDPSKPKPVVAAGDMVRHP
ncbi:hypothetical protein KA093_01730 [Candidatus Saccharibacteria bacterium]|nr:hypothetical protein [Candidatus Saccharibacteria bacterium]